MDPFIEGQAWTDFHHRFIADAATWLTPALLPRYVVRIDERVYVEREPPERADVIRPDVTIARRTDGVAADRRDGGISVASVIEPITVALPLASPETVAEAYLTIRLRETMAVVTVIELLSPSNKRRGSDGRREYLRKRDDILRSPVHLVEVDLLRGGQRLPIRGAVPATDYVGVVSRADERPNAAFYGWNLRQPLPTLPIPLHSEDADARLDLQAVFTMAYDRALYSQTLDYTQAVEPPLSDADAQWAKAILHSQS